MNQALLVIAQTMFRDEEYAHPKEVLEHAGVLVTTASVEGGKCIGKLGMNAHADRALRDVRADDYDGIVFIGGGGAQVYFDDPTAHELAKAAVEQEVILGAICIGPSILARAGVLAGVRATSFPSQEADLRSHGALFTAEPVVQDGLIITANGPQAARAFGEMIAGALTNQDM